ncbi:MAG: peptidylprolyl isomerase [Deltaproteobacteria bacterium]|nr:peptidylprolyl isomerase [Deltaproteobacteria bacterium]
MEKRAELLKVKTANCPTGVVKASNPGNPVVVMETNMGKIELELFKDKSPISVENFLKYIKNGHYSGTIFHRIKSDFMIQGGGFTKDKKEKTKDLLPPIKNEADNGLVNKCGTISMARTNVVDSATAQFFINVVDNNRLNHRGPGRRFGYAVFGQVLNGMDVVNKIKNIPTVNEGGPFVWMPSKTVEILKVTLKK